MLSRTLDDRPLIYLDSAATALKPQAVLDAERLYSTQFTANIHRGKHALSEEASAAYEGARRTVARHLGTHPAQIVFVRNTTEALNLAAHGLSLKADDVVVASACEHHSTYTPFMQRARVELFDVDPRAPMDPLELGQAIARHHPRVAALGWVSNVTGAVNPMAALCRLAREQGVLTVVDAAQAAPHFPIDVDALGADLVAFSGHKMLAPSGIGVLWGRAEVLERLQPLMVGGGTVDRVTRTGFTLKPPPYRFEAGTPNISGALGLAAAFDWLAAFGFDPLAAHERLLADTLQSALTDIPQLEVFMAKAPARIALASFAPTSRSLGPDQLAVILSDSHQIMVRSGFHCAHPCFDLLDRPLGALRASAYLYNTVEEIVSLGKALRAVLARL